MKRTDPKARHLWLAVFLAGSTLTMYSCGADDSEDEDTAATGTFSETSKTKVDSLSSIPDIGTLLVASDSGSLALQDSADAVTGTPPKFKDISADNVETYLSGDVDTLITELSSAVDSNDWDTVDAKVAQFRNGQAKCQIMQDASRQIGDLASASTSSCYMRKIDDPDRTDRLVEYVSGEEVEQGNFFKPAAETVVRAMQLANDPYAKENGGKETIYFEIQGSGVEPGVYQVSLNFCSDDGKLRNKETIRVDNNEGTLTTSMYSGGTDSHEYDGQTFTQTYAHEMALSAGLTENADGDIEFDPTQARTMSIKGTYESDSDSGAFNGEIKVKDGTLTTKFIGQHSSSFDGQEFSFTDKGASVVRYTGSTMNDVSIYEGAGKRSGSFDDGNNSDTFTEDVGFEFNEDAAPQYDTVTSSDYITAVNEIDFATDELLKNDSPQDPDASSVDDNSICSQTPVSVYKLDMSQAGMQDVASSCEVGFRDGDRICDALRNQENKVWDAVHQSEQNQ
jgi:hypothetical protein